ncbi:uncharacterized protein LOC124932402 [Impatiens glandulifera]|uniref:uncharacterized protein LOC124932402 n=1 Tax=Impatiens glandulifera TaxID=253017 RepID=UPI001FB09E2A|nr:uncharacterized protein LOC124932402 [Impatiens glandulifera]
MENWGFGDLESPIQRNHQLVHEPHNHHHHMHLSMNMMTGIESELHPIGHTGQKLSNLSSSKVGCSGNYNIKNDNLSEGDDDLCFNDDCAGILMKGKKGMASSPWQRMKWTDNMVKLLIAVVASVGEDGTPEGLEGMKRKSTALQKKGKWKTASKIMISKGCYVSPQQCEDKFNDLNKRYKKLNDILGRVNSCRVVEDPSIMDSMMMPQLSAKTKEEVKKILGSKHLFYKEMCAYHSGQRIPNCEDIDLHIVHPPVSRKCSKDSTTYGSAGEDAHEDDGDSESEDDHNSDDEDGNDRLLEEFAQKQYINNKGDRSCGFDEEMSEKFRDPSISQWDRSQWIKKKIFQLEEENINIQVEGLEIKKRFFKWCRFRSKKERELERQRLENERMMLENDRMELQLKDKDLEMKCKPTYEAVLPFAPMFCNNMDSMPK